jgi:hypothetical protein
MSAATFNVDRILPGDVMYTQSGQYSALPKALLLLQSNHVGLVPHAATVFGSWMDWVF